MDRPIPRDDPVTMATGRDVMLVLLVCALNFHSQGHSRMTWSSIITIELSARIPLGKLASDGKRLTRQLPACWINGEPRESFVSIVNRVHLVD